MWKRKANVIFHKYSYPIKMSCSSDYPTPAYILMFTAATRSSHRKPAHVNVALTYAMPQSSLAWCQMTGATLASTPLEIRPNLSRQTSPLMITVNQGAFGNGHVFIVPLGSLENVWDYRDYGDNCFGDALSES